MTSAAAVLTFRGLPEKNTQPMARAPARAQATASSTRVSPQILTWTHPSFRREGPVSGCLFFCMCILSPECFKEIHRIF